MKFGKKHRVLSFLLALLICLTCAVPAMAYGEKITISPSPMYIGETAEISYWPRNRKFRVMLVDRPEITGFTIIKNKYIKSVANKTFRMRVPFKISPVITSRYITILRPYFAATGPDQQRVENKEVYTIRQGASLAMDLVCNTQKPVTWEIENDDIAHLQNIDKDTVMLHSLNQGKCKLTATYMGYKYTTMIHVVPGKSVFEKAYDELEHVATDTAVWIRKLLGSDNGRREASSPRRYKASRKRSSKKRR